MSGAVDVRVALETRLAAIASPLATQWENTTYTPIEGTPYQQVFLLPADPVNPGMGRFYQENGYLQVTLRYPINAGPGTAATRAQAIRDWFYKGLSLAANATIVTVNRTPTIGPSFVDGTRYCIPVKVRFFANQAT